MPNSTFEIVVAVRPPYQDPSPSRVELPEAAALLGGASARAASYFLDISCGVAVPLELTHFIQASRAYRSGHRRFRLGWSQDGNNRRLSSLEPANTSWGPSMPSAARAIRAEFAAGEFGDSHDQ